MSLEEQQIGRYRLSRLIGSGQMGEVYLAEDTQLNRQVAIKLTRAEVSSYPDALAVREAARLFLREARAIASLDHPNILPLFDYGETNIHGATLTYMVMPFRQEGSLSSWLQQRSGPGLLSPQEVVHFVQQAADGLQHAHNQQIIHQDVKPSNFLMRTRTGQSNPQNSNLPDLQLADFGIAKSHLATSSVTHTVRGTPAFMAPEQWNGNPVPASDQYALAIMAYELLTGRLPFQGGLTQVMYQHLQVQPQRPSKLNPSLPSDVDSVFQRALAKKPEERFMSISAFANAFRLALLQESNSDASTVISNPKIPGIPKNDGPTVISTPHIPPPPLVSNPYEATLRSTPPLQGSSFPGSPTNETPIISRSQSNETNAQSHNFSRGIVVLLVLLVILVGVTSTGLLYFLLTSKNSTPVTQTTTGTGSTATTQATTNPTTQVNATPTPQATATTAPTSANPYTQSGTLVLNDPLTSNNRGYNWDEGKNNNNATCQFTGAGLDVTQPKTGYFHGCIAKATNFTNFVYEVQVNLVSGDYAGITFCANTANGSYYFFYIKTDGTYALKTFSGDQETGILTKSASSVIQTGLNSFNTLAVVVQNGTISLYVNQRLIDTVNDSTYSQGQIGVFAGNDVNFAEAVFSNAKVWTL